MYDEQAGKWARDAPNLLSDFTGRPVVFEMISDALRMGDGAGDKNDEREVGTDDITRDGKARGGKTMALGGGGMILDVGCGEGYCARHVIRELGATKVVGFDISPEMISCARAASTNDDRFHYHVRTALELTIGLNELAEDVFDVGMIYDNVYANGNQRGADGRFDVAMAVFLFNYLTISDMADVMGQVYRALKPGGTFIFSVPHPSMMYDDDDNDNDDEGGLKSTFHLLDTKDMGYYSSRDEMIFGKMMTLDGKSLNIMSIHKTLGDYVTAINESGYVISDIREAGVTKEHMRMHPKFFESVYDRPLHLVFRLMKPFD
jgi:SAM-dependent methyltransferase